jgi:hypothetical protein
MVAEVAGEEPGVRVFVVQSEERLASERAMREAAMEKTAKLWTNPPDEWQQADSGKPKRSAKRPHGS